MNSNYPDAYPGETEEEYLIRQEQESKSSVGLIFLISSALYFFLKTGVIYGLFMYAGYLLSQKMWGLETDKVKIWGVTALFAYLILSFVFFLKGAIISLRSKKSPFWMFLWIVCVLPCCVVPAFIVKTAITSMFLITDRDNPWCLGLSWGAFVIVALYVYNIYQFKTPNAPRIFYWSFALGVKAFRANN